MNRPQRIACILGAMLAIVVALTAPAAFAGGCAGCNNDVQVFSAPVYAAPQILAAPVYQQAAVFAAPQVVYQQRAVVRQHAVVQAAPVYQQAAVVQKNVFVAKAPRQRLFSRSRSVNIQRSVVR